MRIGLVVVVVAVVVVAVVALASHARVAAELVGQWSAGEDFGDGHGTYAQYDFRSDGTFKMRGYPPIEVSGNWTLVERKPGKLHIKLTHQKMTAPEQTPSDWSDVDAWGELSADGKTFTFTGKQLHRDVPAPAKPSPPSAPPPPPAP